MAMKSIICAFLIAGASAEASESAARVQNMASVSAKLKVNPIRKIVTMLQDMQKTVEAEGQKESQLFEKFMCYCNNGKGSLDLAITSGTAKVTDLTSRVEQQTAMKSQLEQDVKQHTADGAEAAKVLQEATTMREKEAAEFAASSGETKANIEAMDGAVLALKKGMGAAMLQTGTAALLRNVVRDSPAVREGERDTLLSFLDSSSGSDDAGSSDQIVGVIAQMKDTMQGDLAESTTGEETAKANFASLSNSKNAEIAANAKAVETKTVRKGETSVSLQEAKVELKETEAAVADDSKFSQDLTFNCGTKSKEWDERSKLRADEISAISEAIKILTGDEALDVFKKSLPSALIQVSAHTGVQQQRAKARMLIQTLISGDAEHAADFKTMLMQLKFKSRGGNDKVLAMVDGMVTVLEKEQVAADKKRDFCISEIDLTEDAEKALKRNVYDLDAEIAELTDNLDTMNAEIAAVQAGITQLDRMVTEATEQRKEEHSEYSDTAAANSAALQLIDMATNRMNQFYNPTLHTTTTVAPVVETAYGFEQISSLRADPGQAPETFSGDYKGSGASSGIIGMMNQMIKDVTADIAEGKKDEAQAQKDYEGSMADAAQKRASDSQLLVEKQSAKADLQVNLSSSRTSHSSKRDQLGITQDKLDDLHKSCDFLLDNYQDQKKTRATEMDGLKQSKAVLAGASFGFMQKE